MIYKIKTYIKRRALRTQSVDIYSAAKVWSSPFPVEIIKLNKPYVWYSGLCPIYRQEKRNIYVNTASYIHSKAIQKQTCVNCQHGNRVYEFSRSQIDLSLEKEKYGQRALYNYAHECAHKFLSVNNEDDCDHEVQFGIVLTVLVMRMGLNVDPVYGVYNFHQEWQACHSFKKYGIKPTLMALRAVCLDAAIEINSNYTDVLECCEKAMRYKDIIQRDELIIKWAARYKRKILKRHLKLMGLCTPWALLLLCLYLRF